MIRSHATHALLLTLASSLASGCLGAISVSGRVAFSPSYPDNDPHSVATVASQIATSGNDPTVDVAVAVNADRTGIVGFDPSSGSIAYRSPLATNEPIVVAGSYALVESNGKLRLLDVRTGHERESIDLEGADAFHMIGASASDGHVAVSLTRGTGTTAHSRLLILAGDSVHEDLALDRPMGVPAISGDRVIVPWAYQNLSFLDFHGAELARIRLRNAVIGHAIARHGKVWFGATSLFRFGPDSAAQTPAGYTPPDLGIDRPPTLLPNAYEAPAPLTSAAYHVRFAFDADPSSDGATPTDGQVYLVHYRFLFAFDAASGTTRWVRVLPGDVVGIRAFPGGVRAASETGDVLTLAASDGRVLAQASLGEHVSHVAFAAIDAPPATTPLEVERPNVREQLYAAVETPDARLVTAREFALARLAALDDDEATADLGVLCEDTRLPQRTRQRACDLLASRSTGIEHVEAQLRRHGSFLDERPHPPVDSLAHAAASMHYAAAAPLLVEQLRDPRTSIRGVSAIADALVALGDASTAPALSEFLRTYHADVAEDGMIDALGAVANAYARLGGERAMTEVETLASDPLCPEPARRALRDALARVRAEHHPETTTTTVVTTGTNVTTTTPAAARPLTITLDMANQVLAPVHDALTACLNQDPAHPGSVRTILVIRRDGTVAEVHATPASVTSCLDTHIRPLHFQETEGAGPTTRVTLTLRAH